MPMPMLRCQCQDFQIAPEKSRNSWEIKPKNIFWGQIGSKLPPWLKRSFANSHIAYNRTIHLYCLNIKFQLLGICHFRLCQKKPLGFLVQDPFWLIYVFLGGNNSSKQVEILITGSPHSCVNAY